MENYKQVKLFNPLQHDFTTTYDINGDGQPVRYTIHALEIAEFPEPIAEHIRKHLGHELAMTLKGNGTYEDAMEKALARIKVEI